MGSVHTGQLKSIVVRSSADTCAKLLEEEVSVLSS